MKLKIIVCAEIKVRQNARKKKFIKKIVHNERHIEEMEHKRMCL